MGGDADQTRVRFSASALRSCGLVVRTSDSESGNPSSSLGRTFCAELCAVWRGCSVRAHAHVASVGQGGQPPPHQADPDTPLNAGFVLLHNRAAWLDQRDTKMAPGLTGVNDGVVAGAVPVHAGQGTGISSGALLQCSGVGHSDPPPGLTLFQRGALLPHTFWFGCLQGTPVGVSYHTTTPRGQRDSPRFFWFGCLQGTPSGRGVVPHPPPREGNGTALPKAHVGHGGETRWINKSPKTEMLQTFHLSSAADVSEWLRSLTRNIFRSILSGALLQCSGVALPHLGSDPFSAVGPCYPTHEPWGEGPREMM